MLRAGDYLAAHLGQVPVMVVFCFNPALMAITDSDLDRPSVVGGGSVYTAVQNLMLACRAEGLGCVLTTLLCYQEAAIKDLLAIPDDWGTCAHIPIGYPVLKGHGPITRRPIEKLVFQDAWGQNHGEQGASVSNWLYRLYERFLWSQVKTGPSPNHIGLDIGWQPALRAGARSCAKSGARRGVQAG